MVNIEEVVKLIRNIGISKYIFDYSIYNQYLLPCYNWYKGKTPYHVHKVYNGANSIVVEKAKLHMAKASSEDIASLVCNDAMTINIEGQPEYDYLLGVDNMSGVLGLNDFWNKMNEVIELTAALGTAALEIIVDNVIIQNNVLKGTKNTKIKLVKHNALSIIPLCWDNNGFITELAFIDEYKKGNDNYIDLRIHVKNDFGNYIIINKTYKSLDFNVNKGDNIKSLFTEVSRSDVTDIIDTHSDVPWFTCFKLPIINNWDLNSPMGASSFGNAIDELKAIDDAFTTLCGEFRYSNKKVFYNKSMLDRDKKGNIIIPDEDETNKEVFFFTGDGVSSDDDKKPIYEYNPEIRAEQINNGIELLLNLYSFKVGLGHGFYKFSNGVVQKTAKEVISANSALYRNICKIQIGIEKNIIDIIRSILFVSNLVTGTKYNVDVPITIKFDASLLEDKSSERDRALEEVRLNILTPQEYRKVYYPELDNNSANE